MKKSFTLVILFFFFSSASFAQVGIGTPNPDPSAELDITATGSGLLIPRMTTANRPASPVEGLMIFNTDTHCFEGYYDRWVSFSCLGCQLPVTFYSSPASAVTLTSFYANWTSSSNATGYYLDVNTNSSFTGTAIRDNVNVGNVTSYNVTGLGCGTYYYRVRAYNACSTGPNSGIITVSTSVPPAQPSAITPGTGSIICSGVGQAYSVTNVGGVTYTWSYSGTGWSQITGGNSNSITASVTGSGSVTVTPSNACVSGTPQTLAITVTSATPAQPSAITGVSSVCPNQSTAYSVTQVPMVTYAWSYSGSGLTCGSCSLNSITANFSGSPTSGTLTVTPSNACGAGTAQTKSITASTPPTANAGTDINVCDATTATLSGNTPGVGETGAWTVVSGSATVTTPGSPTSGVTGLSLPGTATLRWTVTNAALCSSSDDVVITTAVCTINCGSQYWAPANLNVGTMVLTVGYASNHQTNNLVTEKYCYNDVPANCATYGGLYEWGEAMGYAGSSTCDPCGVGGVQGLCPSGYHIPTHKEWGRYEFCVESTITPTGPTTLATFQGTNTGYQGSNNTAGPGYKMKEAGTTHWNSVNNANNSSGFTALPGGARTGGGTITGINTSAYFWTATVDAANPTTKAWLRSFSNTEHRINQSTQGITFGYSVRCLKN